MVRSQIHIETLLPRPMLPCTRFLTKDAWGGVRCTAGGGYGPDSPGAAVIASSGFAIGPVTHAAVASAAGVESSGVALMDATIRDAGVCAARNGRRETNEKVIS